MAEPRAAEEQLLENIMQSAQAALLALGQLELSLKRGRFEEGAEAYATMSRTLIGQHAWLCSAATDADYRVFHDIGATASRIVSILAPYQDSLGLLTQLSGVGDTTDSDLRVDPGPVMIAGDQRVLFEALVAEPRRTLSYSRLRAQLGWARKRLDAVIVQLREAGIEIRTIKSGARTLVSIEEAIRD